MIISASRRTDLPAWYSEWLFNRLKEEYVLVRNPVNFHQVRRISLSPSVVDGLVIWTKNPLPMLGRITELDKYNYYFQFTLTAYGPDVEPFIPPKREVLLPAFKKLSRAVGRERVVWRYDPLFFSARYTAEYHVKSFRYLAEQLCGSTEKCTLSFFDAYRHLAANIKRLGIIQASKEQQFELLAKFAYIAGEYGLKLDTCAEAIDFSPLGIGRSACIDKARLERLGGYKLDIRKDPYQREACGCAASIDIGAYDTCSGGCLYCYANHSDSVVRRRRGQHEAGAPLLFGEIGAHDAVAGAKEKSCKVGQVGLFD